MGKRIWPTVSEVPVKVLPEGIESGLCVDLRLGFYWSEVGWTAMGLTNRYTHIGREPGLDLLDVGLYTNQALKRLQRAVEEEQQRRNGE